jgi:hypothetical protein
MKKAKHNVEILSWGGLPDLMDRISAIAKKAAEGPTERFVRLFVRHRRGMLLEHVDGLRVKMDFGSGSQLVFTGNAYDFGRFLDLRNAPSEPSITKECAELAYKTLHDDSPVLSAILDDV